MRDRDVVERLLRIELRSVQIYEEITRSGERAGGRPKRRTCFWPTNAATSMR